jgi:hypothetical protein
MHSLGVALGRHTPQSLPTHMKAQVKPLPQVPLGLQVRCTPFTHSWEGALHSVHFPSTQSTAQSCASAHLPSAPQR